MPNNVADKKSFAFVGGLLTEAGPLTYPPNAWSDGTNVVPDIDGSLSRRTALSYETNYSLSSTTDSMVNMSNLAYVTEEWNSVGGVGSRNFLVQQRGQYVYFYDNTPASISATEKLFSINLATYKALNNPRSIGTSPISCASANGRLVITSADTEPILVTYDEALNTINVAVIAIRVRDLQGIDDGLRVDQFTSTLTNAHKYNLYNQGWSDTQINAYFSASSYYPNNAQTWTAGKDGNDDFQPTLLNKQDFGSTPAAKGRYLLNPFTMDRSTASGVSGLAYVAEQYRPTSCAFYAGRAWYAGTRSSKIGTWVMFSQVAEDETKFGRCYQDADPTSEFISDLVASDGGVIPIQDAGSIVRLVPAYNSMLVFADNGVWQITGGSSSGFAADSYEVKKLTAVGCLGAKSVIEAEASIYYWATDGIWMITTTDQGLFTVTNGTQTTVQRFYTAIPTPGITYATGRYFLKEKTLYWLFNSDPDQDGNVDRFKKDSALCVDLRLKAFYTLSFASLGNDSPFITDIVISRTTTDVPTTYNVVDNSSNQVIVGSDDVVATITTTEMGESRVKFATTVPNTAGNNCRVTFAEFVDQSVTTAAKWRDWYSVDNTGATYPAYIVTGYDLGEKQGGNKDIQSLYVQVFMFRTETGIDGNGDPINPSGCLLQARWDWTDSTAAGKWSAAQQVYRHKSWWQPTVPSATFDDGYPVVVTKNKVRGRGKAVQLKFEAEDLKDMQLIGWAVTYIGNTNV